MIWIRLWIVLSKESRSVCLGIRQAVMERKSSPSTLAITITFFLFFLFFLFFFFFFLFFFLFFFHFFFDDFTDAFAVAVE